MSLTVKMTQAYIRLEKIAPKFSVTNQQIYVAHSGGKDSVVIHYLAKQVFGDQIRVIHTPKIGGFNKTHPDTVKFLYEVAAQNGMEMVPGNRMKQHLLDTGLAVQIDGTRTDEADRTNRSSNVIIDGKDVSRTEMDWYTDNGLFGQHCVFPIYDWSDDDVWNCIAQFEIPFSAEYLHSAAR